MYQEAHEMNLIDTHEDGEEEWLCPECGRRFLMRWPPEYSRTVLDPGNEDVIHTGGKGGLRVVVKFVGSSDEPDFSDPDDPEGLLDRYRSLFS